MGYQLAPGETAELLREITVGGEGTVGMGEFLASQMDWADFQVGASPQPEKFRAWKPSAAPAARTADASLLRYAGQPP